MSLDWVLKGGWIVDGSGAPPRRADLGILGNRIEAIGQLGGAVAKSEVDVTGRYLFPGFIDVHVHADALARSTGVQEAALYQGITTLIVGQDGLSYAPASANSIRYVAQYFGAVNGSPPVEFTEGCSVDSFLEWYDGTTAVNIALLVPAGTVRYEVMGSNDAPACEGDLAAMRRLVADAMDQGAVGLSTGMAYVPGAYADATEIAGILGPVAAVGGVYVTHMRGYECDAWRGMQEVEAIATKAAVSAHVSHYHGPATMLLRLVDDARHAGIDLTFDSYPYTRGATLLTMLVLPAHIQSGGVDNTLRRLQDAATRAYLASEWLPRIADRIEGMTLSFVANNDFEDLEGLSLNQAAALRGVDMATFICDLLVDCCLQVGCITTQPPTNSDADVRYLLRHEAHMGASDGIYIGGSPHPRGWGAFARFLGRHVRELHDWTWAEAGVHLAGHPARRFGLSMRGLLREGYIADLAIVDPSEVRDCATYERPRELAKGVRDVFVSGARVLRDGQVTGVRSGRALRRGAHS